MKYTRFWVDRLEKFLNFQSRSYKYKIHWIKQTEVNNEVYKQLGWVVLIYNKNGELRGKEYLSSGRDDMLKDLTIRYILNHWLRAKKYRRGKNIYLVSLFIKGLGLSKYLKEAVKC